jgi:hypothetical protein
MALKIEDLRLRVGLANNDASRDAEIEFAKRSAIALMESYCDRKFPFETDIEQAVHYDGVTLSLRRYPVEKVTIILDNSASEFKDYHLDSDRGLVMLDEYAVRHKIKIQYDGGYREGLWPDDLVLAFIQLFDQQMATGGGGGGLAAGAIQSVTLADVGTVRYATGSAAESAASGQGAVPAAVAALLEPYVRKFA